jgi:Effector Associated Constant Component 1
MTEVLFNVVGYPDSDDQERADLASRLRDEMVGQGVDDVTHPDAVAPDGAKGAALEWAQLVVGLSGTIGPMLAALRGFLGRHPRAAVTLEIEGDTLTLNEASPTEQRQLVEAFLARHGAG